MTERVKSGIRGALVVYKDWRHEAWVIRQSRYGCQPGTCGCLFGWGITADERERHVRQHLEDNGPVWPVTIGWRHD